MGTARTTIILVAVFVTAFNGGVSANGPASAPTSATPLAPASAKPSAPAPAPASATPLAPLSSPMLSPGLAPESDCFTKLLNLSDCLTYVEAGSNLTAPDKACCPELAGLVESNPICLCQLLGNTDNLGVKIDVNKGLKLPSICGVATPPVSLCSVAGVPIGVPTSSEDSTSPGVQPPAGIAASPTTGKNGNGASSITKFAPAFLIALPLSFLLTVLF